MTSEYSVHIMGVCVCEGRVDYVADCLEMSKGTIVNYVVKAPQGISVQRLPKLYTVPFFDEPAEEEQIRDALSCGRDDFRRQSFQRARHIERAWREQWCLPKERIRELRRSCDKRKPGAQGVDRRRAVVGHSEALRHVDSLRCALSDVNAMVDALEAELACLRAIDAQRGVQQPRVGEES